MGNHFGLLSWPQRFGRWMEALGGWWQAISGDKSSSAAWLLSLTSLQLLLWLDWVLLFVWQSLWHYLIFCVRRNSHHNAQLSCCPCFLCTPRLLQLAWADVVYLRLGTRKVESSPWAVPRQRMHETAFCWLSGPWHTIQQRSQTRSFNESQATDNLQ